jgi:hypothetical protein
MPRPLLAGLLGLGVLFGFGSGFASMAWHARHGGWERGGWEHGGCSHGRQGDEAPRSTASPTPPQPQTVVVPAAAAPAPQVFIIMPGASPQAVTPAAAVAPVAAAAPSAAQ